MKGNLIVIGKFILYAIAPTIIASLLLGDPFLSAIIDNGYWYLLIVFLAGVADAVKDTLAHHFSTSVFRDLNYLFWDPTHSWSGGKVIGMKMDAWHIAKMVQTLLICVSICTFTSSGKYDIILVYGFYKWGFNLFYSEILRK